MPFARPLALVIVVLLLLPAAPLTAAQVVGSAWTSPTYGFEVSWAGTDWEVEPAGTLTAVGPERLDRLHLINGVSSLYFEGATRYAGDLASCVAEEANILSQESGVSDVRPYLDAAGDQLVADGPDASAAAFTLTLDVSGEPLELVDYVECRTLIPDEAVLIITLVTGPGGFESELAAAQAVIDTIALAGEVSQNPLIAYGGWIAAAQERPSVAGPLAGELAFSPGTLAVERAGVDAPDFYARVEFAHPAPEDLAAWDFGIGFRDSGGDDQLRLVVDSAGSWFLKEGLGPVIDQGSVVDVDASASGTNIIEIVAVGDTGYFAFNERLVTELALPAGSGGDVFAGAGFFTEDATTDGATPFTDFEVWSLSGIDAQEPAAPAEAMDQATFDALASSSIADTPLAGPLSGELPQTVGAAAIEPAGIAAENFVASATFLNPSDAADQPWDIGIAFREQESGDHYRLTIASDGSWEFQIGLQSDLSGGVLPALNYAAGARNTIEVVVDGGTAGFSVNGAFVSALDVSALSGPGDVWIGTGFHRANVDERGVTPFEGFTVWPLAASSAATPEMPAVPSGPSVSGTPVVPASPGATPVAELPALIPREVALRLNEENESGIDALAVLRDSNGSTAVSVVARDAAGDEIPAIHEGTCEELTPTPVVLLDPLDAQGHSETTIGARIGDLNDGRHAIAIHRGPQDEEVVACGTIPAQQ